MSPAPSNKQQTLCFGGEARAWTEIHVIKGVQGLLKAEGETGKDRQNPLMPRPHMKKKVTATYHWRNFKSMEH